MKALEEKILKEGKVYPGHILKVNSFLNHQIDSDFMLEMGNEIARLFKNERITKILTVEASGIAIAVAAGMCLHVPVVFAKKAKSANLGDNVFSALVHSYTHGNDYNMVVEKQFLSAGDSVLIVDDFLATGNAIIGLMKITEQAGASLVGISAAIEKQFQGGGDELRKQGIRVESLAKIESMSESSLTFCE